MAGIGHGRLEALVNQVSKVGTCETRRDACDETLGKAGRESHVGARTLVKEASLGGQAERKG